MKKALLILFALWAIGSNAALSLAFTAPGNNSAIFGNYLFVNVTADTNMTSCKLRVNLTLGDGTDGNLNVTSSGRVVNNYTHLVANASAGSSFIVVSNSSAFSAGDDALLSQMQNNSGGTMGAYEFVRIVSVAGNNLSISKGLDGNYFTGTFDSLTGTVAQLVRVPNYRSVTVNSGASITATAWNGYSGGIVVFRATESASVLSGGSINVNGLGFRGGAAQVNGEGPGGGTAGTNCNTWNGKGGGGAGHSLAGSNGADNAGACPGQPAGGPAYGFSNLSLIYFGSGGGGGGSSSVSGGTGGNGGGIAMVFAPRITISGVMNASGTGGTGPDSGTFNGGGGGGGSGGSILISDPANSSALAAYSGLGAIYPCCNWFGGGDGSTGRTKASLDPSDYNSPEYSMSVVNASSATYSYYNLTGLASGVRAYSVSCNTSSGSANMLDYSLNEIVNEYLTISIISPANQTVYTSNSSIALNFTVIATGAYQKDQCSYSIDGAQNASLVACANSTIPSSGSLADGNHTLALYSNDTSGRFFSSSVTFGVDTKPPAVSFTSPTDPDAATVLRNWTQINATVADAASNAAACMLEWDGTNESMTLASASISTYCYLNKTASLSAHSYKVWANDSYGHYNATPPRTLTLSDGQVSVSILSPSNSTHPANSGIALNYTATGSSRDSCWYSLDGGANSSLSACSNSTLAGPLSEGQHNVSIYSNSTFGQVFFAGTYFSVDTITPNISIVSPLNRSYPNGTGLGLSYAPTEPLASCWYSLNGSANVSLPSCANTTLNLSDGNYGISVYGNDSANHMGSAARSFSVDSVYPGIIVFSPSGGTVYAAGSLWLNFSAWDNSGAVSCWYSLNGTNSSLAGCSNASMSLSDGSYNLSVYVNDSAGNTNLTSRSFAVDLSAPVLSLASPAATVYDNPSVWVNFTVSDAHLDSCWYDINGTNTTALASCSNTSILLYNGAFNLSVHANDSAGHNATSFAAFSVIDNRSPALLSLWAGNASTSAANVSATTDEPANLSIAYGTNSTALNLSHSNATTASSRLVLLTSLAPNSTYFVNVTVCDASGNCNSSGLINFSTRPLDPALRNVSSTVTSTSATVAFEAGTQVNYSISYAIVNALTSQLVYNASFSQNWSVLLASLTAASNYSYNISFCGPHSNCNASGPHYFLTSAATAAPSSGGGGGGSYSVQATPTAAPAPSPAPTRDDATNRLEQELLNIRTILNTTAAPTMEISSGNIYADANPGENSSVFVEVRNNLNATANLTINVSDNIRNLIILPENITKVMGNDGKLLSLQVNGNNNRRAGVYRGFITLSDGKTTIRVPVTIKVAESSQALLDVKMVSLAETVLAGSPLRAEISIFNLGKTSRADVLLRLMLVDEATGRVVQATEDTLAVETSISAIRSLNVPRNSPDGRYIVRAVVVYESTPGKEASASSLAYVHVRRDLLYEMFFGVPAWAWGMGLGMALILSGFLLNRRSLALRRKRYLEAVDFGALPKKGNRSLFVGKIAESATDAYLDADQFKLHSIVSGATGSGKTFAAQVIVEELLEKGAAAVVFDPTAQWTGFLRPQQHSEILKRYAPFGLKRDDAKAFKGNIVVVNDPKMPIDFKEYVKPGEITVFCLNRLSMSTIPGVVSSQLEEFIVNAIQRVFDANLEESEKLRLQLVFDEVHRVLPRFGGRGEAFRLIERGVREFRKWGVGLMLVSQVSADFVGEIKANIGTELQFKSKYEGDLDRLKQKYGDDVMKGVVLADVGVGMVQNSAHNHGRPYFISFRPLLHNLNRLSDAELKAYEKYNQKLKSLKAKLDEHKRRKTDVFDLELEADLALDKVKQGQFGVVDAYIEELEQKIGQLRKKRKARE